MNQKTHLKIFCIFWIILLTLSLSPQKISAATLEELQSLLGRMEADCAGIEPATRTLTDFQNRIDTFEATRARNEAYYDSIRSECGRTVSIEDCTAQVELILSQTNLLITLRSQLAVEVEKAQIEVDKCKAAVGASQAATSPGSLTTTKTTAEFTSPIGAVSPTQLIGKAIKAVLGILGAVALAIFVYGGFVWMTSGGSPEKIKIARTTLVWAVLGMAVIFLSYAAIDFVLKAFGV